MRKMIAEHAKGRPITVAVTEWNTTAGDWGPGRGQLWSLANALACSRYHNLIHRHCDLVQIACRSNLVNSFCSGCIQTDNYRLYKTPTYYAQQLYATLAGDGRSRIESPCPPLAGPDLSATLSQNGDAVILFAVNDGSRRSRGPWISRHSKRPDRGSPRSRSRTLVGSQRTQASPTRRTALPSPWRIISRHHRDDELPLRPVSRSGFHRFH